MVNLLIKSLKIREKSINVFISDMNSNIFFQPFVGKDYANGGIFGKRIMILGESHYCEEECADCGDCRLHRECMDFTQHVLDDYLNENKERQNWMRTFGPLEKVCGYRSTIKTLYCPFIKSKNG